jgi:hypothetical protein
MNFQVVDWVGRPHPVFYEEPEERRGLLSGLILDMAGQEDYYLGEIAKAEAGETILNCYNHYVDAQMYPDGRVILEELRYSPEDEAERGPPARTELTLQEARQLILDWLAAKKKWYAEREASKRGGLAQS